MDKNFWDEIYRSKTEKEVSWHQDVPAKSLDLLAELKLATADAIIDIGGGESHLVDHLLNSGYRNISILDISSAALEKTKARLGELAKPVKFITCNITKFVPPEQYMLWHDRATFHFLTKMEDIGTYLEIANRAIAPGGFLIVSTFAKSGPDKCSGLTISKYSDTSLTSLFAKYFNNIRCLEDTHHTPWGAKQNFVFCGFKKR